MNPDDHRQEYISRTLMLPSHIWISIEKEAWKYMGSVERVVVQMYDDARIYRAMIETPGDKKRRAAHGVARS